MLSPAVCRPGFVVSNDKSTCEECPVDQYQPQDVPFSTTRCQICPNNTGTEENASVSMSNCTCKFLVENNYNINTFDWLIIFLLCIHRQMIFNLLIIIIIVGDRISFFLPSVCLSHFALMRTLCQFCCHSFLKTASAAFPVHYPCCLPKCYKVSVFISWPKRCLLFLQFVDKKGVLFI